MEGWWESRVERNLDFRLTPHLTSGVRLQPHFTFNIHPPSRPSIQKQHAALPSSTDRPSTASPSSSELSNTKTSSSQTTKEPPNAAMSAEHELRSLLDQLHQTLRSHNYGSATSLLSRAKLALLHLNALLPNDESTQQHLLLARETLELGALISIRLQDPDSFTRYFQQLQPFYTLPESQLPKDGGNASKITGLYLLLLLSQGDYAGFHTLLETLELAAAQSGHGLEDDDFIQYPVRLEQALMEGSYDRVWGETKGSRVPGEEFEVFSEVSQRGVSLIIARIRANPGLLKVLIGTIRSEIASCSEKAYASIPISNAKNLFFLESEGAVVQFSQQRGWTAKDGRVYFPRQDQDLLASEKDVLSTSGQVIENTLGYARELETIV
jgi:hypothetical protein